MSTPRNAAPVPPPPHAPVLVLPRTWLIVLTLLVVVPWLALAAVYWFQYVAAATDGRPVRATPTVAAGAGPWGRLDATTVVISPPIELIGNDWGRPPGAGKDWFFPSTTVESTRTFLTTTGLAPNDVAALMATARSEPAIKGIVLTPSEETLRGLPPDLRARLYVTLAVTPLNINQAQAFRYEDAEVDAWLGSSLISADTRRLVEPLIYRHDRYLFFADTQLVRPRIADPEELRRLAKALLRQKTLRVRLAVREQSEVPGLVEYWGRGGRRTDIRPLLESIASAGQDATLDIIHLLPSFAREHLYRYPKLTSADYSRASIANCYWSSLNFFNSPPDDRYLDVQTALSSLQQDYYLVEDNFELGDIVSLSDERGVIFHTAVYLADNFVFTKNGMSPMAPWVILSLDSVVEYYALISETPRRRYHRRNDY